MLDLVGRLLSEIRKRRRRIVVIGDVMVDRWIHGHVAQCQDGCPKFVQEDIVETLGGAANAERCLSNWDINTSLHGFTQSDLRPIKTRYIEDGRIVFRADNDVPRIRVEGYEWCRRDAVDMVQCAGGVLLSDYDKGFLTPEFVKEVSSVCRTRGIPCVADVKREPAVYAGCTMKCNEDYLKKYSSMLPYSADVIVTHGATNPVFWDGGACCGLGVDLPAVTCVNHVGAGDCFAAHLTLALTYGFSLKESAALSHSAGRVYVQFEHNRPPIPSEIAADLATST